VIRGEITHRPVTLGTLNDEGSEGPAYGRPYAARVGVGSVTSTFAMPHLIRISINGTNNGSLADNRFGRTWMVTRRLERFSSPLRLFRSHGFFGGRMNVVLITGDGEFVQCGFAREVGDLEHLEVLEVPIPPDVLQRIEAGDVSHVIFFPAPFDKTQNAAGEGRWTR
jgi:hypothetical protein